MMSCDLPCHGLSGLDSRMDPLNSVDIGPRQWASYDPLMRLRLFRSPHTRIRFWTLLTSIRHTRLGKVTSHPLARTWGEYCLLTTGPLVAFDSPKINCVYLCLHLTHKFHLLWSNHCMSLSLLDDCQPCLQEVPQLLYPACSCSMVYLCGMQLQAIYDMCQESWAFTRLYIKHSMPSLFSPISIDHYVHQDISNPNIPKPFLRDPNQAQKRAKCMYRIKGSNPVLVLQKLHLASHTTHTWCVSFEWEYFWSSVVVIREFYIWPGCGVQIRESTGPFLRCVNRGMYKIGFKYCILMCL